MAIAEHHGPVYLRFGRPVVPNFIPADWKFEIGKALKLRSGKDVSLFATGHLVWEALLAADELQKQGIDAEVINIHTIKPLDTEAVLASVSTTGCAVTAEEHQINGGLGDSIAQTLCMQLPRPVEMIGIRDVFGESGTPEALMQKYGLNSQSIVEAAIRAFSRK
jgi:transketolase